LKRTAWPPPYQKQNQKINMTTEQLFTQLHVLLETKQLRKLILAKPSAKSNEVLQVLCSIKSIQNQLQLQFIYKYATKEITKNDSFTAGIETLKTLLAEQFMCMDIYGVEANYFYLRQKSGKEKIAKQLNTDVKTGLISTEHNNKKVRLIGNSPFTYLQTLGLANTNGDVKKDMQHKYKQINRYVEIVSEVLDIAAFTNKTISIADMGSGKGYLTFALAEYLHTAQIAHTLKGVEIRQDLVNICNEIATQNKFTSLHFAVGSIAETFIQEIDVLIALHACDTATDDAILAGISAKASLIICAPCCHKQIRAQMTQSKTIPSITKHGILLERQAELVTDALRALWLESKGYKTRIMEFVDVENTPKNAMIVAEKTARTPEQMAAYLQQYNELKTQFGVSVCAVEKC
jgi:tRNA/tmRNA/rRNA uracil-C5-methylase (TrmA/RlmC/RlmD family)